VQPILAVLAFLSALAPPSTQASASAPKLRGRLLDGRGSPLAGVDLAWNGDRRSALARSRLDGTFELDADRLPSLEYLVVAEGQAVTTVVGALSGLCGPTGEYLMVAAPAARVTGRVVDPDDAPIAGASLSNALDTGRLLLAFPHPLDADTFVGSRALSDASGEFALELPAVEGLTLTARSPGRAPVRVALPGLSTETPPPLVLVLQETAPHWLGSGELHGKVLMQDGTPAAGARVVLGNVEARTDERGSFTAAMQEGYRYDDVLCAALPGFLPALVSDPARELAQLGTAENPVVLTLGGPALSISGRLIDSLGNPCCGWTLELVDGTEVSPANRPALLAEHLAGGRESDQPVASDSKGGFRFVGLLERSYILHAEPPWPSGYSELCVRSGPIEAGTQELGLRFEPALHRIRGRVVDLDGNALPVTEVRLVLDRPKSWSWTSGWNPISRAATDARGKFELKEVPSPEACFEVRGMRLPRWAIARGDEWTLSVPVQPNLRFDWMRATPPPISIEALDGAGTPLTIFTFSAGKPLACHQELPLDGVRSYLLAVRTSVTALRMRFARQRTESVPCRIEPGALTQLAVE
jgi:hypothetical protein